jgi:UDP-N-acetylglucosamine acyltransferase
MSTTISKLSDVAAGARLGNDVTIGPFCRIGPDVEIGDGTVLDSHVVLFGNTVIGRNNRFLPNVVIGAEPQDKSYQDSNTRVVIGDANVFREGVTVNRGAEKEDDTTRIGNNNLLMANSHVAHNSHIYNDVILVNGVLLGGHVHVENGAIVSGNSVVHHFSTIGTLAFVSGGCRVPHDIPPYMLAAGSDNPTIKTVNKVGMQRAGISNPTIQVVVRAFKLLFRQHKKLDEVRAQMHDDLDGVIPLELSSLFRFLERQQQGRMGRGREVVRQQQGKAA